MQDKRHYTGTEAKSGILQAIETWRHRKRRYSALGYLRPGDFKRKTTIDP
jgi:transposase InsO family protein